VRCAALPVLWACPKRPVPTPTDLPHTGQSDFHPERREAKKRDKEDNGLKQSKHSR